MTSTIPAALKSADIARFAQRAGQVENAKPAIAYWCNYWIVNQLISRGHHNLDEECTQLTTELMDKLEKTKIKYGDDDTITDDIAAQVYVEQFALETFQRAENAMRANKASRQTADTLLAAAVFLELRQIWEPLDPETSSKVKFAKYHALRIAKAIKAGEDPNATYQAAEPDPVQGPTLNSNGIDSRPLDDKSLPAAAYQSTVEEASDEHDSPQTHSAQDQPAWKSQYPSRAPSALTQLNQAASMPPEIAPTVNGVENYYQHSSLPDVSPLQSPDRGRNGSIGGGYFPRTPDTGEQAAVRDGQLDGLYSSSPPGLPDTPSLPHPNAFFPPDSSSPSAESFRSFPPPRIDQNTVSSQSTLATPLGPQQPIVAPTRASRNPQPSVSLSMPQPSTVLTNPAIVTPFFPPPQRSTASHFVADEEALAKAQKHARWAISALNFEDVNTAIKELRGALESLGAE